MLPGNFDCKIRIKGAAAGKGAKDQKDRKQQRSCRCSCSTRISLLRTNFKKLFRVPIRLYSLTQPASSPAHQGPPVDFEWLLGVFNLLQCRQGDIIILHIQLFNYSTAGNLWASVYIETQIKVARWAICIGNAFCQLSFDLKIWFFPFWPALKFRFVKP